MGFLFPFRNGTILLFDLIIRYLILCPEPIDIERCVKQFVFIANSFCMFSFFSLSFFFSFLVSTIEYYRERAKYYYENTITGEIRWEYPETDVEQTVAEEKTESSDNTNDDNDDDAMDISTTPPHDPYEASNTGENINSTQNLTYNSDTSDKYLQCHYSLQKSPPHILHRRGHQQQR